MYEEYHHLYLVYIPSTDLFNAGCLINNKRISIFVRPLEAA